MPEEGSAEHEMIDALTPEIMSGQAIAAMVSDTPNTTPPEWRWMVQTLRDTIETDGEALGMVLAGTDTQHLMIPTPQGPENPIKMLIMMRRGGSIGSINWVAVVSDTYTRTVDSMTGEYPSDGISASEAFKRGMPGAAEAVLALCVAPDGPGYNVHLPYHRTPEGIVWDEPEEFPPAMGGHLTRLMNAAVLA